MDLLEGLETMVTSDVSLILSLLLCEVTSTVKFSRRSFRKGDCFRSYFVSSVVGRQNAKTIVLVLMMRCEAPSISNHDRVVSLCPHCFAKARFTEHYSLQACLAS